MTLRTTFRETLSSRQIALIGLPWTKNARRIFAIVSTISIPTSASKNHGSHCGPSARGPDWMPITPKRGPFFHDATHLVGSAANSGGRRDPLRAHFFVIHFPGAKIIHGGLIKPHH